SDGGGIETEGDVTKRLLSVAEVVYPSEVDVTTEFLETYVVGRKELDSNHLENVADALDTLDSYTQTFRNNDFSNLPPAERTDAQRVRHYVVNELQYALYTTPVGGRLAGIENPIGHPGGGRTYTKPP
ncbi:MAG: gluconate 2-dehydrogenase subunit 3 family protein, partial [Halobacteria archaeon]|nr:gluconate 2-dehydrogenase subunit 3 family protein [Halobacteria archaeon]